MEKKKKIKAMSNYGTITPYPPSVEIRENDRPPRWTRLLTDGNPETYELLPAEDANGLEEKTYCIDIRWRGVGNINETEVTLAAFAISFVNFKNRIYQPAADGAGLEYWNGQRWCAIKAKPVIDYSEESAILHYRKLGFVRWVYNFATVKTTCLRYRMWKPANNEGYSTRRYIVNAVHFFEKPLPADPAACRPRGPLFAGRKMPAPFSRQAISRIDKSGPDLLGRKIIREQGEPDYDATAKLLFSLDFHKAALGREKDAVETLVTWNGTLIMVENSGDSAWDHCSERSMALAWPDGLGIVMEGVEKWVDRWFAFAVGKEGELVGTNLNHTEHRYLDGYKPGVETSYRHNGMVYTIRAFVTPCGTRPYANIVEVEIENLSGKDRTTEFSVIMGCNKSEATHETIDGGRPEKDNPYRNPLFFVSLPTGYRMDGDGRTVKNQQKEIILHSQQPGRFSGTDRERLFTVPVALTPHGRKSLHFTIPVVTAPLKTTAGFAKKPAAYLPFFRQYWEKVLNKNASMELPEARLNSFYRHALSQILITLFDRKTLRYGAYWYEEYYGPEESVAIVDLAKYGYSREAKEGVEIALRPELMDESNYHHDYRNGMAATTAAHVYYLNRDWQWLRKIHPPLVRIAEWIIRATGGTRGEYAGLLPKHAYGGDIHTSAVNISTNAQCWRGLRDAGFLMQELGETKTAQRYLEEAAAYQTRIIKVLDRLVDKSARYPFVPMAADFGEPGTKNYQRAEKPYSSLSQCRMGFFWHAFAAWMLKSEIFPPESPEAKWIIDYIEKKGGLLLGLARLGKYSGAANADIDPHYGAGYIETLLARGEREKFLLSFYGLLAHGMSRDTFSAPESSNVFPLRVAPEKWNEMFRQTMWEWGRNLGDIHLSEPLSSGANAVALSCLRDMLIREEMGGEKNVLHLLSGIPRRWLTAGKKLSVRNAPSYFGILSIELLVEDRHNLKATVICTDTPKADQLRLYLPHPERLPLKKVRINENDWHDFDAETVSLPVEYNLWQIYVEY